jgi:hypothetical protein
MSVYIVRAFVRLHAMLETNAQLARKLEASSSEPLRHHGERRTSSSRMHTGDVSWPPRLCGVH